jgi:DNA modification methylase
VRYHQLFDFMFVFSVGNPKSFNPLRDRKNNWPASWGKQTQRQTDGSLVKKKKTKLDALGLRFNIWTYNVGHGFGTQDEMAYTHPATLPESLARDHILSWSNPGNIVLDCFAGSGTTLKMAKELGRQWVGIEIAPEYVKLAEKRIAAANVPLEGLC